MSQLKEFIQGAFKSAAVTIGAKPFIIGSGDSIDIVNGEKNYARDYEMHGFDSEATLTVVASSVDFKQAYPLTASDYHGMKCTISGEEWKVGTLSIGDEFSTINLVSMNESA